MQRYDISLLGGITIVNFDKDSVPYLILKKSDTEILSACLSIRIYEAYRKPRRISGNYADGVTRGCSFELASGKIRLDMRINVVRLLDNYF